MLDQVGNQNVGFLMTMLIFTMACLDLMILYLGPVRRWICHILGIAVRLLTSAGCMTSVFFTLFSFQLSSWLLAAMIIECLISVMFSHQVIKSSITVLVIIACLVVLNVHYFYGYSLQYFHQIHLNLYSAAHRRKLIIYDL